jgi:hypothetical protein
MSSASSAQSSTKRIFKQAGVKVDSKTDVIPFYILDWRLEIWND